MLREYIEKRTACIRIRVGDLIKYDDGRIGILDKIELVPNDAETGKLIAVLTVKMPNSQVSTTADKFTPVPGQQYLDY